MAKELAKQYDPKGTEDRIYQEWCDKGYFHTQIDRSKKPFTIVMPPPNVTGQLHMGHAMDETWQDILTRYKRMQGYAALWVPGTDHASIATEAKVVAAMREEGLTKEMLGRDGFLERAWAWKNTYGSRIVSQLKKLGCSCDWQRERFTMDEGCSDAVKEVFVRLYDKGLIYRGNRMVNWCPHCNTSISDAEVEYEEKDGSFWHLLYPVKETGEMLELATTRPETMLGDTAVAINGEDPRYTHLHGCHVVLPLLNKEIPIVCDEHADMTKGTGVVKITPAHDPNDFEVGLRHDLPIVRVFTYDGHMTGAADKAAADALFASGKNTINEPEVLDCGKYAGMTTLEARKAILADLKEGGFLKEIEPLKHEVGTCYRCHSTIEPMVSKQWFVKMEPLAKPAIESVEKGDIKFVPERFTKNYMNWMKNTRDWCISRQLWWGHQIPAWYCADCGAATVAKSAPAACPHCGSTNLTQDPDTLDTWFSSALWPFSTLGWPNENAEDYNYFYPTNTLVTGYDIIGFWVSRMIFSGLAYTGKAPFDTVLIHGIVRDSQGRKIKSGVEVGTLKAWELCEKYKLPRLFFVTGMDDDQASYRKIVLELNDRFGRKVAPFHVPIRENEKFVGFVNVVKMKGRRFINDTSEYEECDIPDYMDKHLNISRDALVEAVADTSEELMERYFAGEEFTYEEVSTALRTHVMDCQIVPVLVGSGIHNQGTSMLMNVIKKYFPSPEYTINHGKETSTGELVMVKCDQNKHLSAKVFKTVV